MDLVAWHCTAFNTTSCRQLDDVLGEKKALALEMKRLQDCIDGHEDEMTEVNARLLAATESLEKRNDELEMMRGKVWR